MQHPVGILGWTGLVGQTLFHQLLSAGIEPTTIATYNSKNLQEIRGAAFGTLYICCMPATKWWVNLHPEEDAATLHSVLEALKTVEADRVILLSTVDVLQGDSAGHERSEAWATHPYGAHRRILEESVQQWWPTSSYILRLPALFGRGLKKNALYDLLHNNEIAAISLEARYQWYNLANLLKDCMRCVQTGIGIYHMVSPPISMRDIVRQWFPDAEEVCRGSSTVQYTLETMHSGTTDGPYISTRTNILREMGEWIASEKWRMSRSIAASNIGFQLDSDVATVLRHVGINCLEVAPTRGVEFQTCKLRHNAEYPVRLCEPDTVNMKHLQGWLSNQTLQDCDKVATCKTGEFAGFPTVSMQSLLWGLPITNIFNSPHVLFTHVDNLARSAAKRGVRTFVFGCPKQRSLPSTVTDAEAVALFRRIGDIVSRYDILFCIEPNAAAYDCTWLNTLGEVLEFVKCVDHPAIRICVDTGNYSLQGDTTPIAELPLDLIGHVQVSAAHLACTMSTAELATAYTILHTLIEHGYRGAISWEAREPEQGFKKYCRGVGQFMNLLMNI